MKHIYSLLTISVLLFSTTKIMNAQTAGNALQFDGVNDIVTMGNVDLNLTNTISATAWVNWSIDPIDGNNFSTMFCNNTDQAQNSGQFWLQHSNENEFFEFNVHLSPTIQKVVSTTSPVKDVWYFVAGTYDGAELKIYVNGVLENTVATVGNFTPFVSNMELTMGSSAKNSNDFRRFAGTMDEVTLWNRALTAAEIARMYTCPLIGNESGMIGYWKLDEASGTSVSDASSSSYDGLNEGVAGIVTSSVDLSCTLPIELLSSSIVQEESAVLVSWKTGSEVNNDYFTLLKSVDFVNWDIVATIPGSGTSNDVNSYQVIDDEEVNAQVYYRLKQTDFDGTSSMFELGAVKQAATTIKGTIFPTIATHDVTVRMMNENSDNKSLTIDVFTINGSLSYSLVVNCTKDKNEFKLNLSTLPSGMYSVRVMQDNQLLFTEKVIVEK